MLAIFALPLSSTTVTEDAVLPKKRRTESRHRRKESILEYAGIETPRVVMIGDSRRASHELARIAFNVIQKALPFRIIIRCRWNKGE